MALGYGSKRRTRKKKENANFTKEHSDDYWVEVSKRAEKMERSKPLDEEIEDDRSTRKKDRGQLSKRKNKPLDALEHCVRRKERQAGEALKMRVKLT